MACVVLRSFYCTSTTLTLSNSTSYMITMRRFLRHRSTENYRSKIWETEKRFAEFWLENRDKTTHTFCMVLCYCCLYYCYLVQIWCVQILSHLSSFHQATHCVQTRRGICYCVCSFVHLSDLCHESKNRSTFKKRKLFGPDHNHTRNYRSILMQFFWFLVILRFV